MKRPMRIQLLQVGIILHFLKEICTHKPLSHLNNITKINICIPILVQSRVTEQHMEVIVQMPHFQTRSNKILQTMQECNSIQMEQIKLLTIMISMMNMLRIHIVCPMKYKSQETMLIYRKIKSHLEEAAMT